jgi:hypothetical protein
MSTGFFQMYLLNVSDAHLPMACIIEGGMLFSAREVAPPAQNDWPAISELKNQCNCRMKKEQVGMDLLLVSCKGELHRNLLSQACKYIRKCMWGSSLC